MGKSGLTKNTDYNSMMRNPKQLMQNMSKCINPGIMK